ncbi:MAG: SAM-dependent methyltransferase [Chloroflexota bacterium]|nr:SAM-dependent methyltransferase [Chloroflexota bacterium]
MEAGRFGGVQEGLFGREQRVDRRLLQNLAYVRAELLDDGLSPSVVNSLVGRSIFVRYLEDRGVIGAEFLGRFGADGSFRDLLAQADKVATYAVFNELAARFNGDLFPVEDVEQNMVGARHLERLGKFLRGDEMPSGQTYFWAYDFKYIPIELISAIYEQFLGEARKQTGAYYTPPELVDFVLNEVLPPEGDVEEVRVLDPACGSGIFLVEAYRRLVVRRRRARGGQPLGFDELRDLLVRCINGVDLSEDAIRVAAFSCYLSLLDFLEPKSIWKDVRFPRLKDTNLFVVDFFDQEAPFNERRYSLVVGNPPWQSWLTESAAAYVKRSGHPIGDRQAAQAFLWRAPELLAPGGRVALLAPSKAVLFNQSGPHREFRRRFFEEHRVTQLVDFSAFRRSLFQDAVAPMVAVFYEAGADRQRQSDVFRVEDDRLLYCTPHPSPLAESLAGVVISGDEVKAFSRRKVVDHPHLWKIALWGTARDFTFIEDLRARFPSLASLEQERGWLVREGLQVKRGDQNRAPDLATMRYIPVEALHPFRITTDQDERIDTDVFHRTRDQRIYRGPHTLIRGGQLTRGQLTSGELAAAFVPGDAVFKDSIIAVTGPPGDADLLKLVCAYVNSSLARYYHFLTASTWGVERDVIRKGEHVQFPIAIPPGRTGLVRELARLVDEAQRVPMSWNWRPELRLELDELVFEAYDLMRWERQLVTDTLRITLDQFYSGVRSRAFGDPSDEELIRYAEAYREVFEATTCPGGHTLSATVSSGASPYVAVSFRLTPRGAARAEVRLSKDDDLDALLARLNRLALEQHSQSLYYRRNVKVFEAEAVHVVKPSERRFWTATAAYNDADDTIARLLQAASPPELVPVPA